MFKKLILSNLTNDELRLAFKRNCLDHQTGELIWNKDMQSKLNFIIKYRTNYLKGFEEGNISCIGAIQSNYYSRLFKGKRHFSEKVSKVLLAYKIVKLNDWKFSDANDSLISTNTIFESRNKMININYL